MKTYAKVLLGLAAAAVAIQFFGIDKQNPTADPAQNVFALYPADAQVQGLVKTACYDCHSDKTVYPWYSNIQPVGWWLKHHVDDGRKHLDFSTFGSYTLKKQDHKLEEVIESQKEGWMPLESYTLIHTDAKLTPEQRDAVIAWAEQARTTIQQKMQQTQGAESHEGHDHEGHEGHSH